MERMYLLTGATGFLGSNLSRLLIQKHEKVRALVMEGDPGVQYIPDGVEIFYGDITDRDALEKFFHVPENVETIVLHSASIVYLQYAPNQKVYDVNVNGTKNIVDLCVEHKVKKLVGISSTGAITELPDGQEMKEPETIEDIEPEKVVGYYSKTKALATQYILKAVKETGLDASVVYPSGICGPCDYAFGPNMTYIKDYCRGDQKVGVHGTFNSVDVRDLAAGILACVEKGKAGEGYIMSNDLLTMEHMTEIIGEACNIPMYTNFITADVMREGAAANIPEGPDREAALKELDYTVYNITRNNNFNCEKAKRELGYTTRSVEETIRDEVEWLASEGKISISKDVCVILGAGSGIGLETAKEMGKKNVVVLAGRTKSKLENAKKLLEEKGIHAEIFACDASDREKVRELAGFSKQFGTIKSVINAAGMSPHMSNGSTIFRVNAVGTIHVNEVFAEYMGAGSTIIDISSMSAYMLPSEQVPYGLYYLALEDADKFYKAAEEMLSSMPEEAQPDMAYVLSKYFVIWYAKQCALKYGKKGIRVISVSPGSFDTPMGEVEKDGQELFTLNGALGRIGKPEEIAGLLEFLTSKKASYITGTDILCDGGTIAAVQAGAEKEKLNER